MGVWFGPQGRVHTAVQAKTEHQEARQGGQKLGAGQAGREPSWQRLQP